MITTGSQIRAGRALLRMSRPAFAAAAKLHPCTVQYWERCERIPHGRFREPYAIERMRELFDREGVVTFDTPIPGVGLDPVVRQAAREREAA